MTRDLAHRHHGLTFRDGWWHLDSQPCQRVQKREDKCSTRLGEEKVLQGKNPTKQLWGRKWLSTSISVLPENTSGRECSFNGRTPALLPKHGGAGKLAFLPFSLSNRPLDLSDYSTALLRQQEHLFQNGLFLTPVQKLLDDKPRPLPHPLPWALFLVPASLETWSQLALLKGSEERFRGSVFSFSFLFFNRDGLKHTLLCFPRPPPPPIINTYYSQC